MKKLIAITVTLLPFNLNGVDRPIYGITHLEGFRNKGVILVIEYYSDIGEAFDLKTIMKH